MPIFQFNKLVRDKLPGLYITLQQKIISRKLTGTELLIALRRKLIEEASELPFKAGTREEIINELSDVEQVMKDIKSELDITDEEIEVARKRKFDEKGGFSEGVFVHQIELRNDDKWIEYYRKEPAKYPELNRAKDEVNLPTIEKGRYLHIKSGHFYEVLGISLQTETNEALVVYRPLWDAKYELFTRPYDMFVETAEIRGKIQPRFQKVED